MRNVVSKAEVLPDPLSLGWNVLGYRQSDVCAPRVVVEFLCVFACVCVRACVCVCGCVCVCVCGCVCVCVCLNALFAAQAHPSEGFSGTCAAGRATSGSCSHHWPWRVVIPVIAFQDPVLSIALGEVLQAAPPSEIRASAVPHSCR